jgi:hypothetical protein
MARLVEDHEDTHSEEEVEPLPRFKFPEPRRSTLLDDTNDTLLHQLDALKGGYEEFQTWSDTKQARSFDQMIKMLEEARDAQKQWDRIHDEVKNLVEKANQAVKEKENLEDQVQNLHYETETLTNQIIQKDGIIEFLRTNSRDVTPGSISDPNHMRIKRKELEDPEKFTGDIDKETRNLKITFEQWKMEIEAKLSTDIHLFDSENRKIRYVGDRTAGSAYNHIWPGLADNEYKSADEVIQYLADIYDDPLKKQKAKQELAKLYQGNWSFHRYHCEFARITRSLKLDEDSMKEELTAKLSEKYSLAVLGDDELTYAQLVKKLHAIDKRLQAAQALNNARNKNSDNKSSDNKPGQSSTSNNHGLGDRKFPNQRTADEKTLLIEKRLCIKCCKPGHIAPNCPESKSLPFPASLKTILQRPKDSQVSNVEAEEGNEDQGNA